MCEAFDIAEKRGFERGEELGKELGKELGQIDAIARSVVNLMNKFKWSLEQALEAVGAGEEDKIKVRKIVRQ